MNIEVKGHILFCIKIFVSLIDNIFVIFGRHVFLVNSRYSDMYQLCSSPRHYIDDAR